MFFKLAIYSLLQLQIMLIEVEICMNLKNHQQPMNCVGMLQVVQATNMILKAGCASVNGTAVSSDKRWKCNQKPLVSA